MTTMALSRSKHWTHGFLLGAGNRSYSWGVIPNVCNYLGHSWPVGLITFGFLISRNFDQRLVTFWGWCDLFPFPKLEVQAYRAGKLQALDFGAQKEPSHQTRTVTDFSGCSSTATLWPCSGSLLLGDCGLKWLQRQAPESPGVRVWMNWMENQCTN